MRETWRSRGFAGLMIAFLLYGLFNLTASIQAIVQPFPGFTLMKDRAVSWRSPAQWSGPRAGLSPLDRVVAVEGRAVASSAEVYAAAAAVPVGTALRYEIERSDWRGRAERRSLRVPTQRFGLGEWFAGYFVFWLSGLAFAAVGFAVSLLKPGDLAARLHLGLCLGFAMVGLGHFDGTHTYLLMPNAGYMLALFVMGACFINLALIFPRPAWPHLSRRLLWGQAAFGAALLTLALACHASGRWHVITHLLTLGYAFPATFALAVSAAWARFSRGSSPLERTQSAIILWTTGLSFTPSNWTYLPAYLGHPVAHAELLELSLILMPLGIAYAIARHRLFGVDWVVQRSLTYTLLAGLLTALYFGVSAAVSGLFGAHGAFANALATALVAVGFAPLRDRVKGWLDRTFFRSPYDAEAALSAFGAVAQQATEPEALWAAYWERVRASVAPQHGAWRPEKAQAWRPETTEAWCSAFVEEGPPAPAATVAASESAPDAALAVLDDGGLVLALTANGTNLGQVRLGAKRSGLPYSERDRHFLRQLSGQLAIALHLLARIEAEHRQRHAFQALAETKAMQDQFLGLVSHELRAPLTVIRSSGDVLERHLAGSADALTLKHQRRIQQAARHMSELVNDLLDAAQLRTGHFQLRPEALDLSALLAEALEELAPMAAERDVHLAGEWPRGELPAQGDRRRLAQVLRNLLHNAVRHSPEGGRVTLSASPRPDGWRLTVADEGPGIEPGMRERLFERFASSQGVGLGLFISRSIAEAHGGSLAVDASGAPGCRFLVELPALPAAAPLEGAPSSASPS